MRQLSTAARECYVIPDYENSLDHVRPAELKAIEAFGQFEWFQSFETALRASMDCKPRQFELITAPADVRCQAIVNLIEGQSARGR